MLDPKKGESEKDFVSRFMSSEEAKKTYPKKEQMLAAANSKFKKGKKESRTSFNSILGFKELNDDLIVRGYIATTHYDGQDRITVEALEKWAVEINDGNPRVNKVSVNHNRDPHVTGVGLKDSAKVDTFPDGEYGLYVETLIDKTKEDFNDIKYRIDNDFIDSFSIEYVAGDNPTFDGDIRILGDDTELFGWTLASQPMNEHAVMVKEIMSNNKKEDVKVPSSKIYKEEKNMTEQKETEVITISAEERKEFERLKKEKEDIKRDSEIKEKMLEMLKSDEIKSKIESMKPQEKVLANKEEEKPEEEPKPEETEEEKELKQSSIEYKEIVTRKDLDVSVKFREVGILAEKKGLLWSLGDAIGYKGSTEVKPVEGKALGFDFRTNGKHLECKSLGITTNQESDTDYLLSGAELRDMFDPVIYDALNLSETSWGLLNKDDYSMKGNNQVQFTMTTAVNETRGFYKGNAVALGNTTRKKRQTMFKKCAVGVAVDGDMVAAARGGPVGDVFGLEVADATKQLINTVNSALNDEVGLETAAAIIGFEYIADSAGNTTLYSVTRSSTNKLAPDAAGDTYISGASARISVNNLRLCIEQATKEGASINNLVFICHPTQERLFKGIYDATQRLVPTSSRFGFEGRPEFDAVPIFADKDINTDDWFCVDTESHRVAIWVPPTLEMLGKRSDADEGFIKMYLATYNWAPRRMVQIHTNATS